MLSSVCFELIRSSSGGYFRTCGI